MSIYSEVQTLIDEASGPVFWSNHQVVDAINIAQLETFTYLKGFAQVNVNFIIQEGSDLVTFNTNSIMIPQYLLDTASNKIFVTEMARLEDYSPTWFNFPSATPKFIVKWDSQTLRVWPRSNALYTYTLFGVPWPSEAIDSSFDMSSDPMVRQAIIHRAASRLFEFTQPELSDIYEMQAQEHEKRYFRQLRNAGGANIWRLAPAKGWQVGQLGDIKIANKYW